MNYLQGFFQEFWLKIMERMSQGIQEWTKQNLWKTAFKKCEVTWSA